MNTKRSALVAALGLIVLGAPVAADVVVLSDGSRLLGTVGRWSEGKITFETKFAGTLEINTELITQIETDEPINVGVETGDRLVGPVRWQSGIDQAVVHTELGDVPVAVDRVTDMWRLGEKSPEQLAAELDAKRIEEEFQKKLAKWSFTLEAGATFREGNTDTFDARGRMELTRKTDLDLLRFYLAGVYGEKDDARNAAEVTAGGYYEHLLTSRLYGYVRNDYEYDEFENLDLRVTLAAGLGYYWIKETEHEWKTRVGAGLLHENYMDATEDETTAVGDVGLDYRLDINPWLRFTHSATYVPTFESLNNYRLKFDTAFLIPLAKSDQWKLKLGMLTP